MDELALLTSPHTPFLNVLYIELAGEEGAKTKTAAQQELAIAATARAEHLMCQAFERDRARPGGSRNTKARLETFTAQLSREVQGA